VERVVNNWLTNAMHHDEAWKPAGRDGSIEKLWSTYTHRSQMSRCAGLMT